MSDRKFSRRDVLKASTALRPRRPCSHRRCAPPRRRRPPITPELIEAAKKEGKVV